MNNYGREEWMTVPETSERYEVSSLGRVRNRETGRILSQREKPSRDGISYLRVDLYPPGEGSNRDRRISPLVHRLIAAVFHLESFMIPEGFEVHHKDRDRKNNRPENLEVLSREDHQAEHLNESFRKREHNDENEREE